jgi:hypothetical protein
MPGVFADEVTPPALEEPADSVTSGGISDGSMRSAKAATASVAASVNASGTARLRLFAAMIVILLQVSMKFPALECFIPARIRLQEAFYVIEYLNLAESKSAANLLLKIQNLRER